ncbi:MAG: pyruvate ferredoxin oxidoreductase alpha subunit [Syntrophus sp. SKADARSKE-3]|nr:pyruvate ferredoxin oxidoreductase alpha subunit [Syntrophus sp. SKADARSKE-3]
MSNVQIMTGNQAAAIGTKLCNVQVVAAYPITPQSSLTEVLAHYIESGQMKAEYVRVEGEHSALTVCIAASTVGARTFTATCANGLLYMHEQIHWAAGSRVPIVMCCVNRGVGAPWTIFNDQQDSIAQRDTGWIQMYCRNNQEIIDTVIQAYRISESVYVPVMVCYDGFILSHTMMPVDIPDAALVKKFLPPYKPHTFLTQDDPRTISPVLFPNMRENAEGVLCDGYMEMRYKLQAALAGAHETINETNLLFSETFGRDHGGMIWEYMTDDAEILISGMGSVANEATVAADMLRAEGLKAGVVGIRVYRPFPAEEVRLAFKKAKTIVLFEKAISYGYEGPLCSDLKAAFYGSDVKAPVYDYIVGLGGRDVQPLELAEAVKTKINAKPDGASQQPAQWLNCRTE